jgi:hypothetical protein
MTRTAKTLALSSIQSTDLQEVYVVPSGINTTGAVLSLTNTTNNNIVVDVYHNNGSTDFLLRRITLPSGIGRERIYHSFQRRTFNAGHSIKLQADVVDKFNFSIHGSEIELSS